MTEIISSEDMAMSKAEAKLVLTVRAEAIDSLKRIAVDKSDVEQAEIEGMIDAIENMYNPYQYVGVKQWQ